MTSELTGAAGSRKEDCGCGWQFPKHFGAQLGFAPPANGAQASLPDEVVIWLECPQCGEKWNRAIRLKHYERSLAE